MYLLCDKAAKKRLPEEEYVPQTIAKGGDTCQLRYIRR